jgi:aryl sulfotransferase
MHILQAGIRKCGNSWLYHILQQIIKEAGIPYQSVIQNDPIYLLALSWNLSFEGQAGVDYLDLSPEQAAYRIGGIYRMPISDIDDYIANTTHVWTHSGWRDLAEEIFPKFDKIVYIVRDPPRQADFTLSFHVLGISPGIYAPTRRRIQNAC